MQNTSLGRHAATLCFTAALLAGCGGSQPPIGTPGAMPQSRAIAQHVGRLLAHPTYLTFYSEHPLKFRVRETGYYGRFSISDSACDYIARVSPKSAKGPKATFKVTPIESPSGGVCVVTIAGARKHTATVTVNNPGYSRATSSRRWRSPSSSGRARSPAAHGSVIGNL
jgi:hypothetical protein